MTTTFPTTHKDHALSRADQAHSIAALQSDALGAIIANVGSAVVHALLSLQDSVDDLAREVGRS